MNKAQLIAAAEKSVEKGEDLQLLQAVLWMYDYGLLTYRQYMTFMEVQAEARTRKEEQGR